MGYFTIVWNFLVKEVWDSLALILTTAVTTGLIMNLSIMGWAANQMWGWFNWEFLSNINAVIKQWTEVFLMVDLIEMPVKYVSDIVLAFHNAEQFNP